MAKTKKTIRKIIWDTERGFGITHAYTSIETASTKIVSPDVSRLIPPVSPISVRKAARLTHDPSTLSTHVLDLRHHHIARTAPHPLSWSSRLLSGFLSLLVRFRARRAAHRNGRVSTAHIRFPAIDPLAMRTAAEDASPIPSRSLQQLFSPPLLCEQYPVLAQLTIGTVILLFAEVFFLLAPFFTFISFPLRFFRSFFSMLRYAYRIVHIECAYIYGQWRSSLPASRDLVPVPLIVGDAPSPRRALLVFAAFALVLILPFYALSSYASFREVRDGDAVAALYGKVQTAQAALLRGEWNASRVAWQEFNNAASSMGERVGLTNPVIGYIGSLFSARVRTARSVMAATRAIADAGVDIATIGETLGSPDLLPTEKLVRATPSLTHFNDALRRMTAATRSIDTAFLPASLATTIERTLPVMNDASVLLNRFYGAMPFIPKILGHDRPMRYLLLFQNDAEARATGGFIGSIAVADIEKGVVRKLFVPHGGSYDLQGSLRVNYRSPEPIQYLNPRFEFQDANWWPDFPTSAKKLLFFFEKSGGPTVDGVIAVNASLFERVLKVVGAVDMPAYAKRIDAENFFIETQKAVEREYDKKKNTPKKFLSDLAENVLATFGRDQRLLLPLAFTFLDAIPRKDLQLYLVDPDLQSAILREGFGGAVTPVAPDDDLLRVVRTNIGGEKTDRVVEDAIEHTTLVTPENRLIDTVTITRTHTGTRGALFTGVRHRDYVRLYVPQGATLLSAEGFSLPTRRRELPPEEYADDPDLWEFTTRRERPEWRLDVGEENERTFFGGWVELDPGEVKTLRVRYALPFALSDRASYRLQLEKQSGMARTTIAHRTILPDTYTLADDTFSALANPTPWEYDMTLLQTFRFAN